MDLALRRTHEPLPPPTPSFFFLGVDSGILLRGGDGRWRCGRLPPPVRTDRPSPTLDVRRTQDIFLLHDPFAGQSFPLPRMSASSHYRAVCLSTSSSTPDSYPHKFPPNFVAAVAKPSWLVLIYRPDLDDDWKVAFDTPKAQDLIFHGDELYWVNREREIRAIHVRTPNLHVNADRTVVTARGHHNEDGDNEYINSDDNIINTKSSSSGGEDVFVMHYLVESCRGELLLVSRYDLDYNKISSKCTGWWRKVGWWKWSTWATTCCL